MLCSGLNLFLAIRPPLAINFKNTNLTYGPILRVQITEEKLFQKSLGLIHEE